jgi:hypothetical protein
MNIQPRNEPKLTQHQFDVVEKISPVCGKEFLYESFLAATKR